MEFLRIYMVISTISWATVKSQRKDIHHMMYETFKNSAMCFRILNGTNQFGCGTSQSGSTGVVHIINKTEDIQWLLESGQAGPYMAVVPPNLFRKDVLLQLRNSPKVSGILLAIRKTEDRPRDMSPDDSCPNRYSSLQGSCTDDNPWNPMGSGILLIDWRVPLFLIKDSIVIQQIHDCFQKFNLPLEGQSARSLCSLQMTGHMYAAVDTPTCLRRNSLINSFNPLTYCDPMGDQNLIIPILPRQTFSSKANGSIVLVTARLDAAALFDGVAPGAVTSVAGIVTLITTAHLVSQLLPRHNQSSSKTVMFALFNGEAHDYIGSSRVVYDMQRGQFPSSDLPIRLEHLDQVIDINQLDDSRHLYCHCNPSKRTQTTLDMLVKLGKSFNVTINGSCSSGKLPPSSIHSFFKANISLPGMILSNHAGTYTNRYYNGIFDDSVNMHFKYANGSQPLDTSIQRSLANIAQTLALGLAQMVDESITWPMNITANSINTLVDELLYCYLESRQCEIFRSVSGDTVVGEGPLPLYVGVSRSPNQLTTLTFLTLANLTGTPTNLTKDQCSSLQDHGKVYVWLGGLSPDSGICMETSIVFTPAVSPAFSIENYNWTSGEYSSWTESVWPELSLRMFLQPAFNQELNTLIAGLVVLFLSLVSVYWINHNADQLFNPFLKYLNNKRRKGAYILKNTQP